MTKTWVRGTRRIEHGVVAAEAVVGLGAGGTLVLFGIFDLILADRSSLTHFRTFGKPSSHALKKLTLTG